jgi:hypothetical protein
MAIPGFTAEHALPSAQRGYFNRFVARGVDRLNRIVPAVPMPYCKTVCAWEVCGSPLPGYPAPMCYICRQNCWIHDSGPYAI